VSGVTLEEVVTIRVTAKCGACGKEIVWKRRLDSSSLSSGNTTERAAYHPEEMRRGIRGVMVQRRWDSVMCGATRELRRAARVFHPGEPGQAPIEHDGDGWGNWFPESRSIRNTRNSLGLAA